MAMTFLASCGGDDDERITATILDQASLNVSTVAEGKNLTIRVEVLSDTINDLSAPFPMTDYCSITFDVDNNNEIDESVDFVMGLTIDKAPCESFIINENTLGPCFTNTDIIISSSFESTNLSNKAHVVWDFVLPKNRFSTDQSVQFRVQVQNPDTILNYPNYLPAQNPAFRYLDKTLTTSW